MSVRAALHRPMGWVDRWFMAPERSAAGRMGLFRILYGLFYLWHLSIFDLSILSGMPKDYRGTEILLFERLSLDPSADLLRALDSLLVAALVLVVFGFRTRTVTAIVLVFGVVREALLAGIALENSNVFLVFYLPLFFLVAGRWGETYSLDAMLGRRRGAPVVDPSSDSGSHFLAARATLVVLAVLFTSSTAFKAMRGGTWLEEPDLLSNLMLQRSVELVGMGMMPNPVAPWIANHDPAGFLLQLSILAFEGLFFLALFSRDLRSFFVATALVFHALNALFMAVTFTPVLIVYGLFVDWQGLLDRLRPRLPSLPRAPSAAWVATALLSTALIATSWRAGSHAVFELGGVLDWRSMWIPVAPIALVWSVTSAAKVLRTAASSLRGARPLAGRC